MPVTPLTNPTNTASIKLDDAGNILISAHGNLIINAGNLTLDQNGNLVLRGTVTIDGGDFILGNSVLGGNSNI